MLAAPADAHLVVSEFGWYQACIHRQLCRALPWLSVRLLDSGLSSTVSLITLSADHTRTSFSSKLRQAPLLSPSGALGCLNMGSGIGLACHNYFACDTRFCSFLTTILLSCAGAAGRVPRAHSARGGRAEPGDGAWQCAALALRAHGLCGRHVPAAARRRALCPGVDFVESFIIEAYAHQCTPPLHYVRHQLRQTGSFYLLHARGR